MLSVGKPTEIENVQVAKAQEVNLLSKELKAVRILLSAPQPESPDIEPDRERQKIPKSTTSKPKGEEIDPGYSETHATEPNENRKKRSLITQGQRKRPPRESPGGCSTG